MKAFISGLGAIIAAAACGHADAAYIHGPLMFANEMSIRNIGAIQHSTMVGAMHSFEGSAASAMGGRAPIGHTAPHDTTPKSHTFDPYMYGKMPMYGEYGDDGTVLTGRSGGDAGAPGAHIWAGWGHYNDDVKFGTLGRVDSPYDLVMLGASGNRSQISGGVSEWGIFGGYISATQKSAPTKIHENGANIGVYNGYKINQFNIALAANVGTLHNKTTAGQYGDDKYNNLWIGGAANMTYNMELTDTFTLQPGLYIGYTWIRSNDYTSVTGMLVDNGNASLFEVSPALRAIKHIGRGWFGTIDARYAFNFISGGHTNVNGITLPDVGSPDFVEYGAGLEKSIDRINISVNIGRRDGGHRGWNGGMGFKYLF